MSRIRSIKPEFWTDPVVVALPFEARLFFIGTWNHADDYGVIKDDPAELRLKILPADTVDPHALIDLLVSVRCLTRKVAPDGTPVLVIRTFQANQKIDRRAAGRYGQPEDFTDPTATDRSPTVTTGPVESPPIPTTPHPGREGKGREENLRANGHPPTTTAPANGSAPSGAYEPDGFADWWTEYPRKKGKPAAVRAYRKATTGKGRVTPALLLVRVKRAAEQWRTLGTDPQFIPHPASWLNDRRFEDDDVANAPAGPSLMPSANYRTGPA